MSYSVNDLELGMYTDFEKSFGLPFLVAFGNDEPLGETVGLDITKRIEEKYKINIIKIISGLNNNDQIKNKVIKTLFHENLDFLIYEYSKKENLPNEFIKIVKRKDGLQILIKGFLKKVCGYVLTLELIQEIDAFIDSIYLNFDLNIVYDRVGKIQRFIHKKIDERHGEDAHLNVNIKQIRNLLSASRLHLDLHDIMYQDINGLIYQIHQSKKMSDQERNNPREVILFEGKKHIPHWRVRHMKSLMHFNQPELGCKIYDILHLETNKPTEEFKYTIISILSDNKYSIKNKSEWI